MKSAIMSVDGLSSYNARKSYVNTCGGKVVACEIVLLKTSVALSCVKHTEKGFNAEERSSQMSPWFTDHVQIFIKHFLYVVSLLLNDIVSFSS